jgi:hypothetical protein
MRKEKNYFAVFGATGAFCTGAGFTSLEGVANSVFSNNFDSVSLNVPLKLRLDSNINAIRIVASVQVLLSKKSVVFCTPPSIWEPLIADDNPPPFGFCTIITTINRKQTIVIKTKKIENVLIVICYFVV